MIPIRDTTESKIVPVVNYSLIGINVFCFLIQLTRGRDLAEFIYIYGLVPARYSDPMSIAYFSTGQQLFSFISFMFLHGGFWHLLGNMWFLFIFGDNVEDHLGSVRYLGFYLACGWASGAAQMLLNIHSEVPVIGASGAIAGVMGAYLILYPMARVLTLIPIFIIPFFVEIPAFFFLGFWFLLQFLSATGGAMTGVAWWAHVGGFVFGVVFLKLFHRVPAVGISRRARQMAERKKTHSLQVIRPSGPGDDDHLYGTLAVTPHEARIGAKKLVNIPWGFQRRMFQVWVPPGSEDGDKLRMAGLGKITGDGGRGDVFLTVRIRPM